MVKVYVRGVGSVVWIGIFLVLACRFEEGVDEWELLV